MAADKGAVRKVLDKAKADGRTALTAPEGKALCDAYGIPVPQEGVASSAADADALSMLDGIQAAEMLRGVRGSAPVSRDALADLIVKVSQLVSDFPEIAELDLNPVFATPKGAIAADVRIVLDFAPAAPRHRPSKEEILVAMNRIMKPDAVAVIGASAEDGKIGNSVMKNLINGGYQGQIYPNHPN